MTISLLIQTKSVYNTIAFQNKPVENTSRPSPPTPLGTASAPGLKYLICMKSKTPYL